MKLTKDEARILADALEDYKFDLANQHHAISKPLLSRLNDLQERLSEAGQDKRRQGRTSQNDFNDTVKRFARKNFYKP